MQQLQFWFIRHRQTERLLCLTCHLLLCQATRDSASSQLLPCVHVKNTATYEFLKNNLQMVFEDLELVNPIVKIKNNIYGTIWTRNEKGGDRIGFQPILSSLS